MNRFGRDITVAFLGNAYFDSRIVNLIYSFEKDKLDYRIISYDWSGSQISNNNPRVEIIPLKRNNSLLFYSLFILSLFRRLFLSNSKIYLAEDVYTLAPVVFFAKLKNAKILDNSRELYGFLAGLREKMKTQQVIAAIEKRFIKYVDLVVTTGEMDSEFIEEYYNLEKSLVLRNLPKYKKIENPVNLRKKLNLPEDSIILLYQGVVLEGRGIIKVIHQIGNFKKLVLVVLGDGAFKEKFEAESKARGVSNQVFFYGRVPHEELLDYTAGADFGLALIENISKSYYYALPNKLFEYIMAGVPVISSNLPQMKNIIDRYSTGVCVDPENDEELNDVFEQIQNGSLEIEEAKENCSKAALELNWEEEYKKLAVTLYKLLGKA